ncbi:uncharacterized protein LOC124642178 [Helicoverpa zea]|uniref:uncharacterized protein LOC124642178 n=1 Tax=Helicoverpa zea TaxID=7113 RepID=UPI001F570874|nr:uncharacterized protein LOC124642178 [Helicoverpa zea]
MPLGHRLSQKVKRQSYSLHKFCNLLKPFLIVSSDGYIIDVFGPYAATKTDAQIMLDIMGTEEHPMHVFLQQNDAFILDRGFRDSLDAIEACGYECYVPPTKDRGDSQLSTEQANESRAVTLCRWVVEVVNGRFKRDYKLLRQNYFNRAVPHMIVDFRIAASLINTFHTPIVDSIHAEQFWNRIRATADLQNILYTYVERKRLNSRRADFQRLEANNMENFPRLTESEIIVLALGTYQLKLARSYCGEHFRNGLYLIETYRENLLDDLPDYGIQEDVWLLRGRIQSRHVCLLLAVASCKAGFEGGYSNDVGGDGGGHGGYDYSAPIGGGADFSGGQGHNLGGLGGQSFGGHDFSGGQSHTLALAQGHDLGGQDFGGQFHGGFGGSGGGAQYAVHEGNQGGQDFSGDSYLLAAQESGHQLHDDAGSQGGHDLGGQGNGGHDFGGQISGGHDFGGQGNGGHDFGGQGNGGHDFGGQGGNGGHDFGGQGDGGHGFGPHAFPLQDAGNEYGHGDGHDFQAHAIPVGTHVDEEHPVEVPNYKHVTFKIPKTVHVNVPKPILIGVPHPYPVKVPVNKPVAVPVETEISIPIEKVVPYPVVKHVPYPVEKHVPIKVEKTVTVHVPQPYPVKIPVYKTIHHHKEH